jgi:MmyB-like transcription regulator ligand binding domain
VLPPVISAATVIRLRSRDESSVRSQMSPNSTSPIRGPHHVRERQQRRHQLVVFADRKHDQRVPSACGTRRPANTARFCFLDPRATLFYVDWDESADASVAVLRAEAARNPHD